MFQWGIKDRGKTVTAYHVQEEHTNDSIQLYGCMGRTVTVHHAQEEHTWRRSWAALELLFSEKRAHAIGGAACNGWGMLQG